ncbi:MAG: sugar transferase [Ignavibacteria bacterium]|nr:sugar transferase [Ignavibacteria bacterium]
MKAFILGAGLGKRLQPLSNELPAPMLPILNKPLLAYIIEYLKRYDIKEIKVSVHHLPEIIDSYLGDGENFNLKISYSLEKDLLGTASALKRIPSFFDDTILVYFGNCFVDFDLNDFYYFHKNRKSVFSCAVVESKSHQNSCEIRLNRNSRIVDCKFRSSGGGKSLIPAGVFLVEKEILNHIPSNKSFSIETDLIQKICQLNLPAYAYFVKGEYFKIQFPKDLLNANFRFLKLLSAHEEKLIFSYSNKIHRDILKFIKAPIFIGSNSELRKNVSIKGTVIIGDNVIIDEGTTISNSLILNDTYIGKNLEIVNSIIYKNLCINTTNSFGIYVTDKFILSPNIKSKIKDRIIQLIFRMLDLVLASIGLILFFPLMLLIAILIKIDSKGPIFYRSKRIIHPLLIQKEKNWYRYEPEKAVFYLKFRTMKTEEILNNNVRKLNVYDEGPYFKAKDDPRVTRVGKILRRLSLDELPLLINVIKGDLSLVGIWGLPPQEAQALYEHGVSSNFFRLKDVAQIRFKGKLGLAGYWQSRGRSELSAEERTIHDSVQAISQIADEKLKARLKPYRTDSVKGYISLILDTIKSVIKSKGAY